MRPTTHRGLVFARQALVTGSVAVFLASTFAAAMSRPDAAEINTILLNRACWRGQIEDVQVLLAQGADPKVPDSFGYTALMMAVLGDQEQIVELLLGRGVPLNAKENVTGRTALMLAVIKGHMTLANRLLAAGADVDERDDTGRNAKKWAQFVQNEGLKERLQKHSREEDEERQKLRGLLPWGAGGGLLLPLLELLELGVDRRQRVRNRRLLLSLLLLPALGAFAVWAFATSGAQLTPILAAQLGVAFPAMARAWRMKPLTLPGAGDGAGGGGQPT